MRSLRRGQTAHGSYPEWPLPPLEDRGDAELVLLARGGDDLALAVLLTRYRGLARSKARPYFLAGGDRDDVVQEAMIGLYKAIRDFDPSRDVAFPAFADLCVTRQVISAVKSANRHKHRPLNASVSLGRPVGGFDGERVLADTLPAPLAEDPAELVVSAERIRGLQRHLDAVLSDLEVDVLRLFVEGRSYVEIAEHLHRQVKAIDNAIQRVKRKIELHLRERALAEAG
ncbi:MAG TPA: RNA polymerase sporulation sigma factor SigH [Mycobacteriales bacterium]